MPTDTERVAHCEQCGAEVYTAIFDIPVFCNSDCEDEFYALEADWDEEEDDYFIEDDEDSEEEDD